MKIDAVDFFYLSMPTVTTDADGSQDALLVRVQAGAHVGWGECEASPLTCIAAYVTPMSHGACRPVSESVLGQPLNDPGDIAKIRAAVQFNSMDLLQAPHTFSGIEIALWDALGQGAVGAGLSPARLQEMRAQACLCLAAVRRHAAGN